MTAQPPAPDALPLATREGLPAEYHLLLADYPREGWPAHRDFNGLAAFWLDRHLNFRRVMGVLRSDAEALIDRRIDPQLWGQRLVRLGSGFLGDLVGHHQIEDDAYFPKLAALEPRIAGGFEVLDRDHHALHDLIERFASGANAALAQAEDGARREAAAAFRTDLVTFERMLARHLEDEEDLVLPVVLKHRVG
jgi:hemerythrin-like domain-containing protein